MASTGDQLASLPGQQAGALEGFSSTSDYLAWLDAYLSAETTPVGTNATVATDQADYAPGATATITASGFATGATVTFGLADLPSDPGDDPGDPDIYGTFTVTDGGPGDLDGLANGTVVTSWQVPSDNDGSGSGIPDALNATVLLAASSSDGQVATTTFTDAADPFALAGDLDGDGTINSADNDIDGDGTLNLDDRTAYDNGASGIPTFTVTSPIVLDFSALADGATPFEGGFTGLAQTSNGSAELNYANNTAVGGTAPATVQGGRLVFQTTNDDTADADSGFTFLADTEGKSFIFAGTFDNPVFGATDLPTFSQYGLLLSVTGADGVTGANFLKLVTGNPGGSLELSGPGGFSGPPKPPLPAGVTQTNYAQVALSLEATVAGGSVTFVGMASYLDASGDVLGTVLTGVGTVNVGTPLYNALTGAPGAPTVAFGITSTDFGSGGSFNIGLQDLSLSKPVGADPDPFALAGDLDGDGTINSADNDIDGDGTLNLDDRTAYDNGASGIPTFTVASPIVLDFSALADGATPFKGGFTGLAQTSNGSAELNYANNTAEGGTAPATVQGGRLVFQTTNDNTADADSGFTFLADTEGKSFIFAGTFDNPVFGATDLPTFSQYGLLLSLTGADGVTGANFLKLVTGNPGGSLELSGLGGFSGPPKPPLPAGVTQTNYAQVALSLEATVTGGSVTFVGMASYLDASGDVLGTVLTGVGTVNVGTPLYNALTGAPGAPTVAFGITSTDFGSGGSFNIGLQDLSLSKPEEVIVEPAGPNFGLEVLASLSAADGIATGGSYGQGVVGSAELDVMSTVNTIQSSNFSANSFKVTNTGTKKIAAVFIDFREALFGNSVIDLDGSSGDSSAKEFQTDSGATETAAFFDASKANVYYLPGEPPLPNTTGTGKASAGGFRGLLLKAGTDGGGFESGETVGFSGDMDPNSLAGLMKSGVNGVDTNAISSWDVGGISGAEIAGSKFFVLFDDGTTASGVLGNSGTQAGAIGKAVQGQAEVPVTIEVNGGSGVYGAGGVAPTIVVSGTPGQLVQVVLAKGLQPVTNDMAGVGGTTGPKSLVEARLAITHPEFPVSNAFDFQTVEVTIGVNGKVIVPTGSFTYSTITSGVSFPGSDVAPIAIGAVAINNEGFAIGSIARDYLTNPTATPVTDIRPGYFTPSGSGNNLFYKIQIEDVAALNGGTNPNGKWNYVTAPDSQGRQTGFQGNGYYVYGSNTLTGINQVIEAEILEFEIDVPTALVGKTLSFRVRASTDGTAPVGEQNDIWLGLQHADGTGSIDEFLVGNGANQPEPISGDFLKVFGGPNNGTWGYAASVDGFPSNFLANVQFPESGRYVLQVAGRSQGFHVDWIELFTGSAPAVGANNSAFVKTGPQPVVLANAIPNQVIADGVSDVFNLPTGTFDDPNNDPITYQVSLTAANGSDVSGVTINETTGQIMGLSGLAIDTYTVTIIASDRDGSASDVFDISIVDDVVRDTITVQAESIANVTGYRLENNTTADSGAMLSLLGGVANETGTASFTFNGFYGLYNVLIGAFDENDGVATIEVAQNGTSIGSVLLNQNLGSGAATANTKVEKSVATVNIASGDRFKVTGIENAGEAARFDFIRFEPVSAQLPTLSIAAGSNGAEAGPVNGSFTVSLSQAVTVATTVSYTVSGTATAGSDYTALSGSVTIPAGQTSATITVPVIDDTLIDPDETVTVTLAAPSGDVVLGTSTASIQIADNEVANLVNLAATTQAGEPATNGAFTVSLETAAATDTVISYSVAGSATGGSDYAALSGTVTIPAGDTSAVIPVSVINDFAVEGNETVIVSLTGITAGDPDVVLGSTNSATITISDDDVPVVPITIQAEAIASLPGGSVSGYRVENYTNASGGSMLSLLGGPANETGTASFTFSGATALYKVEIGAYDENDGAPAASLAVAQNGTSIGTVLLDQDPGGNAASPNTKVTRLVNNEVLLTNGATIQVTGVESGGEVARFDFISFTPVSAQLPTLSIAAGSNGAEEGPLNGSFTVSLSQAVTVATTVSYTVSGTATAGSDYTALSGSVTIPAGQTSATITVPVIDDLLIDPDETVTVTLAAPSGDVVLGTSTASIQIADNEVANLVTLAATTQAGEPATNGAFTVSLETAAATDTVISYSVAGSATGGSDYAALSGTVTIPAGDTSAVIPVSVINDFAVEGNETVIVSLTGITAGDPDVVLGSTNSATITISDDDVPVVPITIQAEAIASLPGGSVSGYRVENYTNASGGSMLSLLGGPANETGTASFTFSGATALYKVEIGAYDENDGAPAASLAVAQNGTSIGTVLLDQDPGGNAASPNTKVTRIGQQRGVADQWGHDSGNGRRKWRRSRPI